MSQSPELARSIAVELEPVKPGSPAPCGVVGKCGRRAGGRWGRSEAGGVECVEREGDTALLVQSFSSYRYRYHYSPHDT